MQSSRNDTAGKAEDQRVDGKNRGQDPRHMVEEGAKSGVQGKLEEVTQSREKQCAWY